MGRYVINGQRAQTLSKGTLAAPVAQMDAFVTSMWAAVPKEEGPFIGFLANAMVVSGFVAFCALLFMPAPYGKYASTASLLYGPQIPGRLAWILQELPALCIPLYLWVDGALHGTPEVVARLTAVGPHTTLLGLFILHYVNRAVIFPFRIRGGKPTPLVVFLMAFAFCCWNGCVATPRVHVD